MKGHSIMNRLALNTTIFAAAFWGWAVDFPANGTLMPVLAKPAHAVVGAPWTPGSAAGVARRTTRRTVAVTSASQQQAQQQQQQAQQQQAASALPKGTVVSALPSGCSSMTVEGVSMFNCGGTVYQPKFQGNQLVYVVK